MMALLLRITDAFDAAMGWFGRAVSWLTLGMVVLGAGNAGLRYIGRFVGENLTSNAVVEAQWYLFSLVFLLGAAPTLLRDRHVRVDVLYGRLKPRGKAAIDLVGGLVFLLPFCAFAIWVSSPSIRASISVWETSPDPGGLPRWPIKAVILVCFGMLIGQGVSETIKRVAVLTGHRTTPTPKLAPPANAPVPSPPTASP
jgi:TRAP-type mannitol/chloroaromatic compound transport system permease small subunit